MKSSVSRDALEARRAQIDALPAEAASPEDAAAIAAAEEETAEPLTLEEYKQQREYTGRILLRIPKELHRQLAENARLNGVSLNQYALYKLAK